MSLKPPSAVIAEDEPLLAQALVQALGQAWPELRVVQTVGDGASAVRAALAHTPEVLFLDIRMPGMDGLQAAAELAERWPQDGAAPALPAMVFVTAYDQYAVQAFEAQAADYLLKPVQAARLAKTVQKLRESLARRASPAIEMEATLERLRALVASGLSAAGAPAPAEPLRVLQLSVGTALHLVPVDDVVFFEAADKYVRVLTAEREYLTRAPLKDLLPRLDPQQFWQIHRGTVVQARHILTVVRDESARLHLTLRTRSEKLAVSRLYAGLFKAL